MLQLIYMSMARVRPTAEDLQALCDEASRNNARHEVTGILLSYGEAFLQVLEGPRTVVEDTFLRIVVDERHHAMLLLHRRIITGREFGDWSMAAVSSTDEKRAMIALVRSRMTNAPTALLSRFDDVFGAVLSEGTAMNGAVRQAPPH